MAALLKGLVRERQVPIERIRRLDALEKIAASVLLLFLAARLAGPVIGQGDIASGLFLVSETIVVIFILARRPTDHLSTRPFDWLVGFGGTLMPLLAVPPEPPGLVPVPVVLGLMLFGFLFQIAAKLSLRRSFGIVAANRGLKVSGAYAVTRHPMYAGYMISQTGFLLSGPTLWNALVIPLGFILLYFRMIAEERVLAQDPDYRRYMERVRFRVLPPFL
ncbi:methyltransferase family protein [Prosthecomicrobium sp. N25]|uniref:methyltransferase family protein n=1 Tax=Prosthecomicrobium sp. N25 TaxID=3129254 RepID=UPI003077C549